jgi:glucose-6-phosphate 1-epimerase
MPMSAAELASKFRIAGVVEFVESQGLVKAVVARGGMIGEVYLQGAQITAWQPAGAQPVIFLSSRVTLAPGKAIRGGIPVIFPWFGPHPTDPKAPQHGLVRAAAWQLGKVEADADGITLELSLSLEGFALIYRVIFGEQLRVVLGVRNISTATVSFEEALHTYFAVSDIERVSVSGLEGSSFIDKTADMRRCPPAATPLTLRKETDSVYLDVPDRLVIRDPGLHRSIVIEKTGAASTIVWNPWPEKAAAMADLGADNWRGMICVESGNAADNRVNLAAGDAHEMTTRISLDAG